jgi:hypothetical protein
MYLKFETASALSALEFIECLELMYSVVLDCEQQKQFLTQVSADSRDAELAKNYKNKLVKASLTSDLLNL